MLRKLALAIGIVSLLSACAIPRTKLDSNPAYTSHQYSNHELEITWKSVNTGSGVRIDGTVKNVRQDFPYNSLQLTAKLLDASGQAQGKESKLFPDRFSGSEPFTIEIPVAQPESVKRIDFSYSYRTVEDFFRDSFSSVP